MLQPVIGRWYTEVERGTPLYCVATTDQHACLAYRPGDPVAVAPNKADFERFFEDREETLVYAWAGYLHDLRTHLRLRGLTHSEETFVVNTGSPTRLLGGPGKDSTVRVTDIRTLNAFNQ